ncbi:MAG: hypothetical protein DIJKHBIC_02309 [Thermoanaerobaculia bacterium]|nr:hypothetical protein [Thermoanaerobaculia bacterium]
MMYVCKAEQVSHLTLDSEEFDRVLAGQRICCCLSDVGLGARVRFSHATDRSRLIQGRVTAVVHYLTFEHLARDFPEVRASLPILQRTYSEEDQLRNGVYGIKFMVIDDG